MIEDQDEIVTIYGKILDRKNAYGTMKYDTKEEKSFRTKATKTCQDNIKREYEKYNKTCEEFKSLEPKLQQKLG